MVTTLMIPNYLKKRFGDPVFLVPLACISAY